MEFGDKLKQLREEYGLSRDEFAQKSNISYSALSKYENNDRFPDKDTIIVIADFFGVSIDFLFGRVNIKNSYIDNDIDEDVNLGMELLKRLDSEQRKPILSTLEIIANKK